MFEGVSFTATAGQLLHVSGVNGAGKTTLMRVLASSLTPTAGDVLWYGKPASSNRSAYLADMIYLGHHPGVKVGLTPRENLAWLLRIQPRGGRDIDQVLRRVGLSGYEDVPCHTLSAGQLRRVALARLYLTGATLWILDEPFTSIDKDGIHNLEQLMGQHLERGGVIVLSSHQRLNMAAIQQLELERYAAVA